MRALARVGVFVQMAAVELSEAMGVARKMRRSPIENDADTGLMTAVDELHKFRGRAVAARGSEITQRLVAPGSIVRMLHDGEQLSVRVAEFLDVRNKLVGQLAVAQPRSEEHTSELQSHSDLVCRLLLEKKKQQLDLVNARE